MKLYTFIEVLSIEKFESKNNDFDGDEEKNITTFKYIASTQEIIEALESWSLNRHFIGIETRKFNKMKKIGIPFEDKEPQKFLESLQSLSKFKGKDKHANEVIHLKEEKGYSLITLEGELAKRIRDTLIRNPESE